MSTVSDRPARAATRRPLMAHYALPRATGPRVLSDPSSHPYVDRLAGRACVIADGAARDPERARADADRWDLAHLHLGLDSGPVDWLPEVIAAHREVGTPTVLTVHQLQPPHLRPDSHDVIDVLRAVAEDVSELLTLTRGCAAAIHAVTGRRARVVPHGPLVPGPRRRRMRAHRFGPSPGTTTCWCTSRPSPPTCGSRSWCRRAAWRVRPSTCASTSTPASSRPSATSSTTSPASWSSAKTRSRPRGSNGSSPTPPRWSCRCAGAATTR